MFTLRSCHWFIRLNLPSPQISVILLISVSRFDATRKDGWIRREAAREGIGNLGFMSFKAENKVLHWVFGAHSHEGWHQWSGTLVAIPKAIRSIFLWSLSLADRWRNLWNLWSFRSTERGLSINNQSRKDLEDVLEAFNFKSYQIRSEVTERKQAHGFNVENEGSFWKLIGNVGCRLDSHLGYGHTIIPTMGDQRDSRMSLCSRCAGTHTTHQTCAQRVAVRVGTSVQRGCDKHLTKSFHDFALFYTENANIVTLRLEMSQASSIASSSRCDASLPLAFPPL